MRTFVLACVAFVLSCCAISGMLSVWLALITGTGAIPQPYHVLIGLFVGAIIAIVPALVVAWFVSRQPV